MQGISKQEKRDRRTRRRRDKKKDPNQLTLTFNSRAELRMAVEEELGHNDTRCLDDETDLQVVASNLTSALEKHK